MDRAPLRALGRFARVFVGFSLITACGGHGKVLEPRFVAVHNALSAMGMTQSGPISEGSLRAGEEARIDVELASGRCYTFVVLGEASVDDLALRVVDAANETVAEEQNVDRHAAVEFCPRRAGRYQLAVTMSAGRGDYIASTWEGGRAGAGRAAVATAGDSCAEPIPLRPGEVVHGSTAGAANSIASPCAEGNAPEVVYQLAIERASQVAIAVESSFDAVLYLMRSCGQPATTLACNDDFQDTTHSRVDATLEPGTYFVVVDGYADQQGEFDLTTDVQPLRPIAEICGGAQPLPIGRAVNGSTSGGASYFRATCADGAGAADRVYSLEIARPSRVRIHQRSQHDGVLHVRRSCEDATTEIACNDDFNGTAESLVTEVLDPGRYYVISDGYAGQGPGVGDYVLTVDLGSVAGGSASADACGAPGHLVSGQEVELDTLEAADDLKASCGGEGGPDVVYRLDVRTRSRARVLVRGAQFEGHVYVTRGCGERAAEVACGAVAMAGAEVPPFEVTLDPGTYHVVVDGRDARAFGRANLQVELTDLRALERACRAAPLLRAGRTVTGSTNGRPNQFEASCAGNTRSGDALYRIRLTERRHVVVELSSDYDAALHLRRSCADRASEVACNDDHEDQQHSRIEADLDRGTYFVVVDGFEANNTGSYSLEYTTTAAP